jgi:hypothetical protein
MNVKSLLKSTLAAVAMAAVFAGIMTGCRTVGYAEMSPTGRMTTLLPPVEAEIDTRSLEGVFGVMVTSGYMSDSGYYEDVSYANPIVLDLITLYDRDIRNIAEEYGPRRGSISCRVVDGEVGGGGFGFAFLSGLTLFVPNLLGLPLGYSKAVLQLEMSVLDGQGALIGRYTSQYNKERVPIALYYGYGSDAPQKVAIDAFKACMTDLKEQIELDFERLNSALAAPVSTPSRTPETPAEPALRMDW